HGGVISVYACALLGCSFNSLWRLRVDNASLTVVRPPRLVSLNDTAHLPGALAPAPHVRASLAAGAPAAAGPAPAPSDPLAPSPPSSSLSSPAPRSCATASARAPTACSAR